MGDEDRRETLPDRRDHGAAIARIQQRLDDGALFIAGIERTANESVASLGRLETKIATLDAKLTSLETAISNGLATTVRELHRDSSEIKSQLIAHIAREDVQTKAAQEERTHAEDSRRRLLSFLMAAGTIMITTALGVIGYLFHLNFGTGEH